MDAMAAIRETFFQECEEQLSELETGLLAMEGGDTSLETVNAVFRAVHSIKGGAGAFKLDRLVRFAHTFETTLDLIRSEKLTPTSPVLRTMLRAADILTDLVNEARGGETIEEARTETLIAELKGIAQADSTKKAVDEQSDGDGVDGLDFQPIAFSFDDFDPPAVVEPAPRTVYTIAFHPTADLYRKGNESLRVLRELARLGTVDVQCLRDGVPTLDSLDPQGAYLSWRIELATELELDTVREVFEFVVDDCELEIVSATQAGGPAASAKRNDLESGCRPNSAPSDSSEGEDAPGEPKWNAEMAPQSAPPPVLPAPERSKGEPGRTEAAAAPTIRVDLERVDRLINLVGELVINQAMLSQRVMEAGFARSSSVAAGLGALEQLTREIQEGVMAIRAQPVKPLFQRMTRIVRELADATGKSVRLRADGEATEVDRTVIERLADPLTHMIRNAVDHGLEKPESRAAAGKSPQGEVRLSAAHRSGRIVIEVSDDGAGIDRRRVKETAVRKELIPADAQLSDSEIDNLLFLPGFSTAATVSNISGRGVGMDVVKRSIQSLGGRISIASRPGHGSTFSMSLPLTLAVLDGMVVNVADQTLVVPLTAIVETLRPKTGDVHGIGLEARVISDRGGFAPLIDVGRELGYRGAPADPMDGVILVVETEVSTRCALIVDAIHDQRQVVIKSLEANYRQVPGIAAATILGDGRVALILDIDTFVARSNRNAGQSEPLLAAG